MKQVEIGLFGLNPNSDNLGCAALSYAFISLLEKEAENSDCEYGITFFDSVNSGLHDASIFSHPKIRYDIYLYNKKKIIQLANKIKEMDIFFDFTAGDSFTDYYGIDRFVKRTFNKTLVLTCGKKLILGPQTYGPFESRLSKIWAKLILNRSTLVYSRDKLSVDRIKQLTSRPDVKMVTDVAFTLDYDRSNYSETTTSSKIKVGLNISGLLYSGGYTKNNQFNLSVDYREYCDRVLSYFSETVDKYDVWLIPHATSKDSTSADNDYSPLMELKERFPFIHIAPIFETPVEVKSFIANMDIFTGARMHATIAAFSAGVVTIPFSYSIKFEGLYRQLNYPYCINGKKCTTDEAFNLTIRYIENRDLLKKSQEKSLVIASQKLGEFQSDIREIFKGI